jgi:hypothetical protein
MGNMGNTDIIAFEKLYYDEYEYYNGDGFYPSIEKDDTCSREITVSFIYNNKFNCWVQNDSMCISGLDADIGIKLLKIMNTKYNLNCTSISNTFGLQIYPK